MPGSEHQISTFSGHWEDVSDQVMKVVDASFPGLYGQDEIRRFFDDKPDTVALLLETGRRITGICLAEIHNVTGYVQLTAVSPDSRGQGQGKSLSNAMDQALKVLGCNEAVRVVSEFRGWDDALKEKAASVRPVTGIPVLGFERMLEIRVKL